MVMTEQNYGEALNYFNKFRQEYRNTPTWPRAIMAGFMIYQNKGQDDKALAALKDVHRRFPDTEWGKRAYYHQGEFLYAKGQKKESQKIFAACQKKYTDTWLARGASQYLEKIKAGEK